MGTLKSITYDLSHMEGKVQGIPPEWEEEYDTTDVWGDPPEWQNVDGWSMRLFLGTVCIVDQMLTTGEVVMVHNMDHEVLYVNGHEVFCGFWIAHKNFS